MSQEKKPLVVTVEDDQVISELVEYNLINEGYEVITFRDGNSLIDKFNEINEPAVFILDIMMPGVDGIELARVIRNDPKFFNSSIIMLTARGSEMDKVKALDAGADDYVTKPFGVREFLARVNASARRYTHLKESLEQKTKDDDRESGFGSNGITGLNFIKESLSTENGGAVISLAGIVLDDSRHRVFKAGREIEMTNREYELLKFFMINAGIAFSRESLLEKVWGYDYAGETRTVDVHVRQLRRKIEDDDSEPWIIETVRGKGYRFTDKK